MTRSILADSGFKLGLYPPNCSCGLAVTTVPERWSASWDDNFTLAQLADEVGIDFLLSSARWFGYGGETDFHDIVLDPIAWAGGILARTKRITTFSTIHTAFHHPIVMAKQLATLDRLGQGRAGVNIVAGWNKPEYDAFGVALPENHDDRYDLAQEWWDLITRIWREPDPFEYEGRFFQGRGVEGQPKPVDSSVPVLNAGSSNQGRNFAVRNAHFMLTIVGGPDDGADVVHQMKTNAREQFGRDVSVFTVAHVVCRPTKREAEEYLHYYAEENADWEAVDNLMRLQGLHAKSFTEEMLQMFRKRFASGHGSCPIVGTPDDVADELERYYQAGFGGLALAFVNYLDEFPYFAQEVLPRLEARGIRVPQ